jgi:hypothetical protein
MENKSYFVLIFFLLLAGINGYGEATFPVNKPQDKDSIIVTFGDKTRMIIYGENRQELNKILAYDLNALLMDLKMRLDSTSGDTTYLREEFSGMKYLKDSSQTTEKDYVRIGIRGIHIKDGDTEVTINARGVEVKEDGVDSTYRRTGKHFNRSGRNSSPRKGFNVALGLNTYGTNKSTPGYDKSTYALKPFGSRFVSLGYVASSTILRAENARLHLDFGVDFSWYNLMFDGNYTVEKGVEKAEFNPIEDDEGNVIDMKKSKLTVPYVNLSFMPTVSFPHAFISYISAGVYGGYRLGSYTKLRSAGSKDVNRVRENFYIEDLRYGIGAEIGIRNFPDFFVNYDLNGLYVENKGPALKMLSFGVRLF